MNEVMYLRDLPCYQKEAYRKDLYKNHRMDLSRFPTEGLRRQAAAYFVHAGSVCTCSTLAVYIPRLHRIGDFLCQTYPHLADLREEPEEILSGAFRAWLIKNGDASAAKKSRKQKGVFLSDARIRLLKQMRAYLTEEKADPEDEAGKPLGRYLYLRDLECYKKEAVQKDPYQNLALSLFRFPTIGLRLQAAAFFKDAGEKYSCTTVARYMLRAHQAGDFLSDVFPHLTDLSSVSEKELVRAFKKWRLANGKAAVRMYKSHGKEVYAPDRDIAFLVMMRAHALPEDLRREEEKDIWDLSKLEFPVRDNPSDTKGRLNFTKIRQDIMRREAKDVCMILLRSVSVSLAYLVLHAACRFSAFLLENHKEIRSFTVVSREVMEQYLVYLRTGGIPSYASDIENLKRFYAELARVSDQPALQNLLYPQDHARRPETVYRTYSEEEIRRLNEAFLHLPAQSARIMLIHESLGCRISDTLTLKQDCLTGEDGRWMVRIDQVKTGRPYRKEVDETCAQLVLASIRYTRETYGTDRYVFVKPKNPKEPMRYQSLTSQLYDLIRRLDLRDDAGRPFGAGTHLFRHTYGQKLTEMGFDDGVIAHLLGHSSLAGISRYRKSSPRYLAEETRAIRSEMSRIIEEIAKEWPDDEI